MTETIESNLFTRFCDEYSFNEEEMVIDNEIKFSFSCYKNNNYFKNIQLISPNINLSNEVVIIDFKIKPYFEFMLRNTIYKLGKNWSYTIVCGNKNFEFIKKIIGCVSNHIQIIKLNIDELTEDEYNLMLTKKNFWNLFFGEKLMLMNGDVFINFGDINIYLSYDYIGITHISDFYRNNNDHLMGALTLRSKSIMLKIINTNSVENTPSTMDVEFFMEKRNLKLMPECLYFYYNAKNLSIGNIARNEVNDLFCSQNGIISKAFSWYKFWRYSNNWEKIWFSIFKVDEYYPTSDIDLYLKYLKLDNSYNKNLHIKNAFDVDLYFCKKINSLNLTTKEEILRYIQVIGMEGIIYHPKQLLNIFPSIKFTTFYKQIFVNYKEKIYLGSKFVSNYLYNNQYDSISKYMIKKRFMNFNKDFALLVLVFIGNQRKGKTLVDYLIKYVKIQDCNIAFCFNINNNVDENFRNYIKDNLKWFAVYEAKEFGTDITPTILMYDDIQKTFHFNHIIKLHSKTIEPSFTDLTKFLLDKPLNKLVLYKNPTCNCIGPKNYYIKVNKDKFNNELKIRYIQVIKINNHFVSGTIFYSPGKVFKNCLQFFKNHYKIFLFNNLYENNSINLNNSPIHFLERLFGCIKY